MIEDKKDLFVVGDIHGLFRKLVHDITCTHKIKDSIFIIVGDCGFGFEKRAYYDLMYKKIEKRLLKNNNSILCIRGNHDDPQYFTEGSLIDYPLLKTLPDYTTLDILGKNILFLGGATSTDGDWRREKNKEFQRRGSSKRVWWDLECPSRIDNFEDLPTNIDFVISHEAPSQFPPHLSKPSGMNHQDYLQRLSDREYLSELLKEVNPDKWFFGNYHKTYSGTYGKTLFRGLDKNEILKIYV